MTDKTLEPTALFDPLRLPRGPKIANRLFLAPMTNCQSGEDGLLSEDEYRWLTMRAEGRFGLVTTCASHVAPEGKGFPGQLGCSSEAHLPGLARLASGLRDSGAISSLQLHHAGIRAVPGVGDIIGPSDDAGTGARAMKEAEIETVINAFVSAARRAETTGFDGVQIHGGHGYLIAQFLSPELNRRTDRWGGSPENRSRFLFEVLHRTRAACGPGFQIGIRISTERFGLILPEMVELARRLFIDGAMDYLDLSLWDITKEPEDARYAGRSLMSLFVELDRGECALGVAGGIMTAEQAKWAISEGADYVAIGKAGILAHDFPKRLNADPGYVSPSLPVMPEFLREQGCSDAFVGYLRHQRNFVQ
ncbi:NADH:flavin oxidoreductase [Marinibacterium sp. SX1]|uniref:NADH:flavin oxidoreductase n=1 Tax=Marinibacterium sp. SX1 TaxID=3388424 RepID=UPI003D184C0E